MKKGDIAYKVVRKNGRRSCRVWHSRRLCLRYHKGTIVKKIPNTIGIMVFSKMQFAEQFANITTRKNTADIIIKVRVSGKIIKVRRVVRKLSTLIELLDQRFGFLYKYLMEEDSLLTWRMKAPEGTYAVGQVEVLE